MKPRKTTEKKEGLSDEQLVAKYDTGKPVDFEKAVKKMVKGSSRTARNKGR